MQPAVIKGGATNCIRFPVFGSLKRLIHRDGETGPLPPAQVTFEPNEPSSGLSAESALDSDTNLRVKVALEL